MTGSIYGGYIIHTGSEEYVLWCVDKNGIEMPIIFTGFDENDISAIDECKDVMFEPVEYHVNLFRLFVVNESIHAGGKTNNELLVLYPYLFHISHIVSYHNL